MLVCSVFFQFLAAYLSFRFVLLRRLGRPWILVSIALTILGGLHIFSLVTYVGEFDPAGFDPTIEMIEFAVSFLLAVGFLLTERWYLLKERLEGRFRLIGEIDRALIGVLEEGKILSSVCDGLVREQGYRAAWIGAAESDGSISIAKSAGEGEGFFSEVPLRWDDTPEGGCPPGVAVRTGKVCVVNRVFDDPRTIPWRSAAAKFGIRSFASVRIELENSSPLLLSLGGKQKDAFDDLEMEAIAAMAYRVGTAVMSARRHEQFVSAKRSYGELFQSQRDGLILVRGGAIVRVNPAAVRILGYSSPGELVGSDPAMLFPGPKDSPLLSRILQPCFGNGDRIVITEMRRKDGSLFEGEIAASWVPRPMGNNPWYPDHTGPLGMLLIRDVTLRSQTLEELRRERDFSAKVLDVAGMLVLQIGEEDEICTFNRQCEEVTGYRAAEVIGRKMTDVLLPESVRGIHQGACEGIRNGKIPEEVESSLLTKEGEERLVIWNYAAIPGPDGRLKSILVAGTDVTERRRFERSVVSMQKMEAVGTLAGGIAHDFNNILTGILGNLDLARKHLPPGSPAIGAIDDSIRASERAAHLIRQLLEFSRRTALERRSTDLKKVVDEVLHLFSQTIDKRIEVSVSTTDDLWFVKVDSSQVHQVLMNLCVNARDAIMEILEGMREVRRKTIWVRAENLTIGEEYCRVYPFARTGEFVALSIADNGIGMDEATQRRVFEPFFTTKGLGRGTGLGLSTVYGIIKQHEGWITLESEPGTGTTFRCYFPRSTELPEEVGAVTETKRPLGGTETILLVDDEEMVRDLASQILTMQGYLVLTAADGQQAIDMYRAGKGAIHLVLLDLTMPRMSGLDVLERIHELDPEAKVILSSGYRVDGFLGSERFAEASAFLPKPYRAQMLSRTVRDVLDGVSS
ncbi:MAG TPA: PAS domain S-box protein [Candidatus Deferrimicrobiaceae bacterium]|nr:PAS domain S-box protein [Candidatus Deferrimicrobiaceae bacterium]